MSLVVFYWTGLFELALSTHTGHLLMTAHFVITGYLFAWVLIGVDPGPKRWSPALRLIVLFATIAFHAFFGVAMITGTALLGGDFFPTIAIPWVDRPPRRPALRRRGRVGIGELPALVLALIVAMQWFRTDRAESVRGDRKADRTAMPSWRHTTRGCASRARRPPELTLGEDCLHKNGPEAMTQHRHRSARSGSASRARCASQVPPARRTGGSSTSSRATTRCVSSSREAYARSSPLGRPSRPAARLV